MSIYNFVFYYMSISGLICKLVLRGQMYISTTKPHMFD